MGYLLWLVVMLIWGLMQWQNGNVLLKALLQDLLLECLIGFVLITVGGIVWQSWQAARGICRKRLEAAAQGDPSEIANNPTASNGFTS